MVRLFVDDYNRSYIWTYGTPGPGYSSVMSFQKYVAEFVRRNTAAHTELCCSYVLRNQASVDMHEDHMMLAPSWAPFPLISSSFCVVGKYRSGQLNVWSADKTWHCIPKRKHECTRYVLNLSPCALSLNASIKSPVRTLLSGLENKDRRKQEKVEKHRERRPRSSVLPPATVSQWGGILQNIPGPGWSSGSSPKCNHRFLVVLWTKILKTSVKLLIPFRVITLTRGGRGTVSCWWPKQRRRHHDDDDDDDDEEVKTPDKNMTFKDKKFCPDIFFPNVAQLFVQCLFACFCRLQLQFEAVKKQKLVLHSWTQYTSLPQDEHWVWYLSFMTALWAHSDPGALVWHSD